MNLVFPFKNISTNTLLSFVQERDNIRDFILTSKDEYPYVENYFTNSIERYKEDLPNFENEILQVINTTSQQTIEYFFNEFYDDLSFLKQETSLESIKSKVREWNLNSMKFYNEKIEKDSDLYFSSDDRKRKHLEEYEERVFGRIPSYIFGFPNVGEPKVVKKTNYNFYCVEDKPNLIDEDFCEKYYEFIKELKIPYLDIAKKYVIPYDEGKIKSKLGDILYSKPVIFVEGEHDITYINKAANLLGYEEVLKNIELRQRGGYSNLDKLWNIYRDNNWETVPQKKMLLYDCDTQKSDEENGDVYKRIINTIPENMISKGIENLFPTSLIEKAILEKKAFIDITKTYRIKRGVESEDVVCVVNNDEKKNLCDWICNNATADDFKHFDRIFELIKIVL